MIRFFKNRIVAEDQPVQRFTLGRLELHVMDVLWARGSSSVREVVQGLSGRRAYTTIMTTLDRDGPRPPTTHAIKPPGGLTSLPP